MIQSVVKALRVLEQAADSPGGITAGDIAQLLGVKPTTAFNTASTLTRRGYLFRSASRPVRYRLGPSVYDLVDRHHRGEGLRRAEVAVRDLAQAAPDATVIFAEAVGADILMTLRIDPSRQGLLQRPLNKTLSPFSTALALCFQAFWSTPEREAFLRQHPFEDYHGRVWRDREELDAALRDARQQGFVSVAARAPFAVAVPVFTAGGDLAGALGLSLPAHAAASAAWTRQLLDRVRQAGADLGRPASNPSEPSRAARPGAQARAAGKGRAED